MQEIFHGQRKLYVQRRKPEQTALKYRQYTPDTLTIDCDNKYFHISDGTWSGENLYQLYQKAYTPWKWQEELLEEAEKVGIDFFSTPFDNTGGRLFGKNSVEFYKIASFELVDIPLIEYDCI